MKPATRLLANKASVMTDVAMVDQMDEMEAAHTAYKILRASYLRERLEVFQSYLKELRRQA
jgi:hypothetical protein